MNKHHKAIYGRMFASFILIAVMFTMQASVCFTDTGQRSEWVKLQATPAMVTPVFEVPVRAHAVYPVELDLTSVGVLPEVQAKCRSPGNTASFTI